MSVGLILAAPVLTVTSALQTNQIVQRAAGTTSKAITFSGTFLGVAPTLTGHVRKVSDDSIVATLGSFSVSANAWSASATVPQGGPYYLEVSNGSVSAKSSSWGGVGAIVLLYGQSNMGVVSSQSSGTQTPNANTYFFLAGQINFFVTAGWQAGGAGDGSTNLLNILNNLMGIPVAAVNMAVAASDISFLVSTYWFTGVVPIINQMGGDFEALFWNQGENNTTSVGTTNLPGQTEAEYASYLLQLQSQAMTQTGRTAAQVPLIVSSLATSKPPNAANNPLWAPQQKTLYDVGSNSNIANITYSHTDVYAVLNGTDGTHMTATDCQKVGKMFGQTAGVILGLTSNYPHWFITAASIATATTTTVTMTHSMGTDFTPTSGISGFEVSGDGGATWGAPSASVRASATTITLTHGSLPTTHRMVRYCYGSSPDVSNVVFDNSSVGVPLNFTPEPITCSSPSVPVPTFCLPEGRNTFNNGTLVLSNGTPCELGDGTGSVALQAFVTIAQSSTTLPTSVTLTPHTGLPLNQGADGTAVTMTKVVSAAGCTIWAGAVPSGFKSCTVTAQYPSNPFGAGQISVLTVPSSLLNSAMPVGTANATMTVGDLTHSVSLATSSGGFVVAVASTNDTLAFFSGTEAYAKDHILPFSNSAVGHSALNATNASSTVTCNMSVGASASSNMVVASWR